MRRSTLVPHLCDSLIDSRRLLRLLIQRKQRTSILQQIECTRRLGYDALRHTALQQAQLVHVNVELDNEQETMPLMSERRR